MPKAKSTPEPKPASVTLAELVTQCEAGDMLAPAATGRIQFMERSPLSDDSKITEADGRTTITNVAVVKTSSRNKRLYPRDVLEAAIPKYEGAKVFIDHRSPDSKSIKSVRDLAGSIHGVYFDAKTDTLMAKELRLRGPAADVVKQCAESAPDMCGLSHNVYGKGEKTKDGWVKLTSIDDVESVDLVSMTGSTKNLFESANSLIDMIEGDLTDRVASDEESSRLYRIYNAACTLINRAIYEYDADIPSRAKKIVGILGEWVEMLREKYGVSEGANPGGADPSKAVSDSPTSKPGDNGPAKETNMDWKDITSESLKANRPDLVSALIDPVEKRATEAETKVKAMESRESATKLASKLCDDAKMPAKLRTTAFVESLVRAGDEAGMKVLVEDRMALAPPAQESDESGGKGGRGGKSRPRMDNPERPIGLASQDDFISESLLNDDEIDTELAEAFGLEIEA